MWIVYFALAISLLALAVLVFQLTHRRSSAHREASSSSESVTIASVFLNIATLLVALVALYVAFQSLSQSRPQARPPAAASASAAPAAAGRPDVWLEFEMSAKGQGVILVNESASQAATEISCQAQLWDLDDPDDDSFQDPIATPCATSYLNPRGVLGPARLVEAPANQPRVIENSDRFFGYVTVGCPRCLATRAHAVYFVLGANQGWYARAEPGNAAGTTFARDTTEAAAAQFLARADKQPIRRVGRL